MSETLLTMQAGVPYSRRIRVTDGKNLWTELSAFEVRCEVRRSATTTSTLYADLSTSMVTAFSGNDIVIDLELTGAQTRELRAGYYDVFLSDVGPTDARALRILHGRLQVKPATTRAAST